MIDLYHCKDARSFRVIWALEELGLPYRLHCMSFPPRRFAKSYLEINPLGSVPLLLDDNVRLTESVAILQYLVTRYGPSQLAVVPDEEGYGTYLDALVYGEATLATHAVTVLRYARFEPEHRRLVQAIEDGRSAYQLKLRALDRWLDNSDFVAADRFTMADISVGYAVKLAHYVGISDLLNERISAYWARLSERPAYLRAMAAESEG